MNMIIATDRQAKPIKISTMTGKLAGFRAINTNTLSNPFCDKMRKTDAICKDCYSAAMLQGSRKNCVTPWENNSVLLSQSALPDYLIPRFYHGEIVRYHGHGEIINRTHALNLALIAEKNPQSLFVLWSKRRDIVRSVQWGDNVTLIYSNPNTNKIMTKPPKGFHRVFNVTRNGDEKRINCYQNCADCMLCYTPDNGVQVIVEKMKKRV